ncbi:MAG TPA: hypothetical protein VNR87_14745 [Flavisolibacter sp.]|nr:hypothetical protein [Flavisolibacter sp.]
MKMKTNFNTGYIDYTIEQGIIIASYKNGVHINLDIAKEIVEARIRFSDKKSYPVLINSQGVVSMDKAARDYFSSEQGIRGLKAAAIVVNSPFSSFLGNFFLWVNRTRLPVKIFTNHQAAFEWLGQFLS